MRKILLGIILVLLVILGINMVTNGIEPFGFKVQSMGKIEEDSKTLKSKIEESNRLIDTDYRNKVEKDLPNAETNMQKAKKQYLEYVNKSTNEQIIAAKTLKSYTIEFLWMKLGTHAREEGVNLTFEVGQSGDAFNFTVDGSYIAITNFIYAIENDSDLDFRIQNFKLLPHQGEILEATFTVSGVTIQGNLAQQSSSGSTLSTDTKNDNSQTSTDNKTNETKSSTVSQ